MGLLVGAIGIICVVNFILTVGVVQRLRDHTEHINRLSADSGVKAIDPPGGRIGEFRVQTTDGEWLTPGNLPDKVLVGAFAHGCPECAKALPEFLAAARRLAPGSDEVLAVIVGEPADVAAERRQLEQVARVVVEEFRGEIAVALGIRGYPAFGFLDFARRVVLLSGTRVPDIVELSD